MFVPVVDISKHQAKVDFGVMRSRGVEGVIIRAAHANLIDSRLAQHVRDARAGGYSDRDLGFYTFMNPKRASATASAKATVEAIRDVLGHTDTFYMVDVEDYRGEPPNQGTFTLFGSAYASYLREHIDEVRRLAPEMRVIAYANHAYWSGPVPGQSPAKWVHDSALANELEWMVPRYHVGPPARIKDEVVAARRASAAVKRAAVATLVRWQREHCPPEPARWGEWATTIRQNVKGPITPNGVPWEGWQFSADWNGQGVQYGMAANPDTVPPPDLDLNIVRRQAWQRWTGHTDIDPRIVIHRLVEGPGVLAPNQGLAPGEQRISQNGATVLVHQSDGNVVVYKSNKPMFDTRTDGRTTASLVMQDDGNLVLYGTDGAPLWSSQTDGNPGAALQVEDGRIVVYSAAMRPLWSSDATPHGTGQTTQRRTAVVGPNDGWISIARRELGDRSRWRELARLNGGETRMLHPGDVIVLPD